MYQDELDKKGYNFKLEYDPTANESKRKRKRSRKISWFNPPFSKNVKTNVGAKFLNIISKNFPKNNPLSKILNRNTVKVSYRCMPNLKACIDKHNRQVINMGSNADKRAGCNCQVSKRDKCPLPGRCATRSVVYRASVRRHDRNTVDCYTGLTGDRFKDRYSKHMSDIRLGRSTKSKLSSHVCRLKENNIPYGISWEIVTKAPQYNP